ncbi:ABC transporter permease subunit [Peribacillus sp. B-H-3]|uniref:ABC transporter permease subunit n=1 Tax=Peribacillus sp. B-H-3 TaxID=3400420 RepID=UPI003B013AAF
MLKGKINLKTISHLIFNAFVLLCSICAISSLPSILYKNKIIGFYPEQYIQRFISVLMNLFSVRDKNIILGFHEVVPLFSYLPKAYTYSMTILLISLILSMIIAVLVTYIYIYLPRKAKKIVMIIITITEILPDIFIIISIQYFIIYIYKHTGIKIFQLYGFSSNVYVIPIFCLMIIPLFMLIRLLIAITEEEYEKMYVEFAVATGVSRNQIFFKHVFRNLCYSLLQYLTVIYWVMLSSLIIIEYLFQMKGFTLLMYRFMSEDVLAIGIILILIPYGIIFLLIKTTVIKTGV